MGDKTLLFKVVDVSKHNGTVDFRKVAASGIRGVIIRAGYGRSLTQKDPKFETYYRDAKAAGLLVGAYWYSYTLTVAEAITEANCFLDVLNGKQFELPVYIDLEEKSQLSLGSQRVSNICATFCDIMEKAGYYSGIYSFDSMFNSIMPDVQRRYTLWVARVENVKPKIALTYDMHQYSWKANVSGMQYPECDISDCFKDFPSIIKKNGLNGFKKEEKYRITARSEILNKADADKVSKACSEMGMTVIMTKENT